jgi:hypothetical protein
MCFLDSNLAPQLESYFLGKVLTSGIKSYVSILVVKMAGGKRPSDNDTSKGGVVMQRVICEVGGRSSYFVLTKTNYSDWVFLMKVKLNVRAPWMVIQDGGANQQEEMMALDALYGAIPPEMVPMIAKKETAKGGLGCDRDHEGWRQPREEGDNATAVLEVQPHHFR